MSPEDTNRDRLVKEAMEEAKARVDESPASRRVRDALAVKNEALAKAGRAEVVRKNETFESCMRWLRAKLNAAVACNDEGDARTIEEIQRLLRTLGKPRKIQGGAAKTPIAKGYDQIVEECKMWLKEGDKS